MGAELFHAEIRTEGQTDMTKLIVAFRNFANATKNSQFCPQNALTFRHQASYVQDRRTATLQRILFLYLVNKYI
jgi:hypothetical protein